MTQGTGDTDRASRRGGSGAPHEPNSSAITPPRDPAPGTLPPGSIDEAEIPVIRPGSVRAQAHTPVTATTPRTAATGVRAFTLVLLALLVIVALGVFLILPDMVEHQPPVVAEAPPPKPVPATEPATEPAAEAAAPAQSPAADEAQRAEQKREAEALLGKVLRRRTQLEAQDVAVWGGEAWEAAQARVGEGDARFADADFPGASTAYTDTLAQLDALEASKPQRLETALAAGAIALVALDADAAEQEFRIALALDPGNETAQRGLERAANIEQVAGLMASGQAHEDAGDMAAAQADYQAAVALDPEFEQAGIALERVNTAIAEQAFQQAMSEGLSALEKGAYGTARKALEKARALKPDSTEVNDALSRVRAGAQRQSIARHRSRASTFETEERWQEAADEYAAVLAIDANTQFAVDGRARSTRLAKLHSQLDVYLKDPGRLHSKEPLHNAEQLLKTASSEQPKGKKLEQKLASLTRLVEVARTPVPVLLRSDEKTDVVVYKVGRFGRFAQRELMLRPGTYVVHGTREGYRDVHREFTVTGTQDPPPVVVRCEERI